jgi:hypothetical protein
MGVDATALPQGAISTFFARGIHHQRLKPLSWRHWRKRAVAADLDQQFLLSQTARLGPWNDRANLSAVVELITQEYTTMVGLSDAEFGSERNHSYMRQQLGAQSMIPTRRGKKAWRVREVRAEMRRAFPQRLYRH